MTTLNGGYTIWNWIELYGDAGLLKTETKAENLYMIVESDWISCQTTLKCTFQSILLMVGNEARQLQWKNPLYNYIIAQNIN
jgi:hypothetical protein